MKSPINDARFVLEQLQDFESASVGPLLGNAETANEWIVAIEKILGYLENHDHPIVFIGSVGVGKSALIGVVANLLAGPTPTDRTSLKNNSVLAIGSGRTTVCEVCISASEHPEKIGLVIEPFSLEDATKEIEIYADDEWRRLNPDPLRTDDDDSDPSSQEIQRAIRGLTGYVEYQETYSDGNLRRRRMVRPLDNAVRQHETSASLAAHLISRAELNSRTRKEWWFDDASEKNLRNLKLIFESVNQGTEPSAMLPVRMTVKVPDPIPGSNIEENLTLIDTRGLDGPVESRADLQKNLRDPRAIILLCASFKDAPGETARGVLQSMTGDIELRQALSRTLLLLVDQGDAEQVNGANGDRESGQEIKIDECHIALEGTSLSRQIEKTQIIAFDALNDDRGHIVDSIAGRVQLLRKSVLDQLDGLVIEARRFLANATDVLRPQLRDQVDQKLVETLARFPLVESPLRDPLVGLYDAISRTRYASVVNATCRRRGSYARLDLYAAVEVEASRAATEWLDGLMNGVHAELARLEKSSALAMVVDHISLRRQQYARAQLSVIQKYAQNVKSQVELLLKSDDVWDVCCGEWGRGGGFKGKVIGHLKNWARKEIRLNAHETTEAIDTIPLLREVSSPIQAPQFTLHVRNLRALRNVSWSPLQVSLLIGANGAGKTSLLLTLRLLRLAYERGLAEAVKIALGGSSNLKTWGVSDDEPIEIGIGTGNIVWRIQLAPKTGSVDHLATEYLTQGDREVFVRDSLGAFVFGDERLEASQHTGLRVLMDRGEHDPAIRAIAAFVQRISIFHEPDLWSLRWYGSSTADDQQLNPRGGNALTILRRWFQERNNRHRYEFVLQGLKAAFPNGVEDIDFDEAGNTLVARIYKPGAEVPQPIASEANGLLQLLILFCAVASAEDQSVIAIDEPENSLHPYAVTTFLRRSVAWARRHNLTIILATHSTVMLDALSSSPENVFVMRATDKAEAAPVSLDMTFDREWLETFKLGDLYSQGELGSNDDNE